MIKFLQSYIFEDYIYILKVHFPGYFIIQPQSKEFDEARDFLSFPALFGSYASFQSLQS